jgi:hypothetical protein
LYTEIRDKMRRPKLLHPIISDMTRKLSVAVLARAGAFKGQGMQFPFMHVEVTARGHARVFRVGRKTGQIPQIVAIEWRKLRYGMRPFFICPRCNARRWFLYHDGLFCYCRQCAGAWYWSQRKHRRTRLLNRSHRLRLALGDQDGKPGDKFPDRPKLQRKTTYRRIISTLRTVEQRYMHILTNDRRRFDRDRDEHGRYLSREEIPSTEDLGT